MLASLFSSPSLLSFRQALRTPHPRFVCSPLSCGSCCLVCVSFLLKRCSFQPRKMHKPGWKLPLAYLGVGKAFLLSPRLLIPKVPEVVNISHVSKLGIFWGNFRYLIHCAVPPENRTIVFIHPSDTSVSCFSASLNRSCSKSHYGSISTRMTICLVSYDACLIS